MLGLGLRNVLLAAHFHWENWLHLPRLLVTVEGVAARVSQVVRVSLRVGVLVHHRV